MNQDVFDRAVRAYQRFCARNGYTFQQPARGSSEWERAPLGEVFVLRNKHGELMHYRLDARGALRAAIVTADI